MYTYYFVVGSYGGSILVCSACYNAFYAENETLENKPCKTSRPCNCEDCKKPI